MTNEDLKKEEKSIDKEHGLLYNLYVVILNSLFK